MLLSIQGEKKIRKLTDLFWQRKSSSNIHLKQIFLIYVEENFWN